MALADPYAAPDPLEARPAPERVNYATGVLLQADDFEAEQTYHRGRLAQLARHLLGFGTLAGLRVIRPAAGDNLLELRVEPGLALDRHGRLIEVGEAQCIRLAAWFTAQDGRFLRAATHDAPRVPMPQAVVADVFLSAKPCGRGKTPSFASGPFDALDALVPARLAETPQGDLSPAIRFSQPAWLRLLQIKMVTFFEKYLRRNALSVNSHNRRIPILFSKHVYPPFAHR